MKNIVVLQLAIIFIVGSNIENVDAKMSLAQVTNAIKPMRKQCVGKIPVSTELLDSITAGGEVPADPDLQCYYACLFKALKVFKDGKIQIDSMIKQVDMMMAADEKSARIKEVLGICESQATSSDPCVNAWEFAKCFYETDRSACFLP